jgi:hypothetical protein
MAKKISQKNVSVTMTLDQARALRDALDFYSRICIGQIEEVERLARFGIIPIGGCQEERQTASSEASDSIKGLINDVKAILGYSPSGSNSIGNPYVHSSAHRAWELKKVIAKTLAEDNEPNPQFRGVDYDGLIVRYTSDPAPVAVIE